MKLWQFLPLVLSLLLVSCQEQAAKKEEAVQQEAVIQKEVESRVEVIRGELKAEEERGMTIRTVCFSLLAGGSLVALFCQPSPQRWFRTREDLPDAGAARPFLGRRIITPRHPPDETPPAI